MMHCGGSTNAAPNLCSIFSWNRSCDVDYDSALALNCVPHITAQAQLLDELNAQLGLDNQTSKQAKHLLDENPLISSMVTDSIIADVFSIASIIDCFCDSNWSLSMMAQPRNTVVSPLFNNGINFGR